jgi:tRNA(Ile)-lysidine synthase
MEITGAEAEFAGEAARSWLGGSGRESAQTKNQSRLTSAATIENESFANLPVAVQRKILQRQLMKLGVAADFELIERLRKSPGKNVSVSAGLAVARDAAGKIELFDASEPFEKKYNEIELKLKLSGRAGRANFGGRKFNFVLKKSNGSRGRSPHQPGTEFFDADMIGDEIFLRHWRAGDRFRPMGMKSPVKLQDLFVNAKIPRAQRRDLVLAATAAGEIFWVENLRIGDRFKLTPETRRRLVWNVSNLPEEFALQRRAE